MSPTASVRLERRPDGIAAVILSRPQRQNAFTPAMAADLAVLLESVGRDETARLVVVEGDGGSFSAGIDPDWAAAMANRDPSACAAENETVAALLATMDALPQPVVASVRGAVIGIGFGLVACADIAIAAEDATFAVSDVRLGLVPSLLLPYAVRAMGARSAARALLTAERFDAAMAMRCQLVHQVVASRKLERATQVMLARLGEGGPDAQRAVKALLRGTPTTTALIEAAGRARLGDEAAEGLTAFLERRQPRWQPAPLPR